MKQLLLLLALLGGLAARAQAPTGTLVGTITADTGQPLPGMAITVGGASARTAEDGSFVVRHLPAGTYVLEARGLGFAASQQNVRVEAGKTSTLNLQLNQRETTLTEVTVQGNAARSSSYVRLNAETATRTPTPVRDVPQAIQTVPQVVLAEQQAYRLSDVFKNVAGVTEQGDFNYVNIRGFLTTGANFMVNGQRNGYYSLDESPQLPYVERVEVLKGASSVLYGNGAIGGTINLITKQPRAETSARANFTVGSLGLTRLQADVTGALNKSRSLTALLSVGLENGGSYYPAFRNRSAVVTPVVRWNIGERTEVTSTTILRTADETSTSTGIPVVNGQLFAVPVRFRYASGDGSFTSKSVQEQLSVKHTFGEHLTGNLWLSAARRSTEANMYGPGGNSPRPDSITRYLQVFSGRLRGYALNAYLNYQGKTGPVAHTVVVGFDYTNSAENYPTGFQYYQDAINPGSGQYPVINKGTSTPDYYYSATENYGPTRSAAGYVQDQLTFSKKVKALLALRYDNYRYSYYGNGIYGGGEVRDTSAATAWLPKLGLVYQPTPTISLYGSYSHAFQPQSSNSRLSGGPFAPLRAKQFEVGLKGEFLQKRLLPTITLYHIREVNALKPVDPANAYGPQRPTGEVTSRGLELTLTGALTANWNVLANYAKNRIFISKSTIEGEIGSGFGDTPRDAFSVWTTYQPRELAPGLKVGVGYRTNSERVAYGLTLPAFSVLDALVSYQYRKVGLAVNGFNLTGKRYATGTFGSSYYFEGAPRNVQVSLSYNWL